MNVSVGVLHSSVELLSWVATRPISVEALLKHFGRVLVCCPADVLAVSFCCEWVEEDDRGKLHATKRGRDLYGITAHQARLREQLRDVMVHESPPWVRLVPKGRKETLNYLHPDTLQVFDEAGLTDAEASDEIVAWWDSMAATVRGMATAALTETGRTGERLTIAYEHLRTQLRPEWRAIESELCGYDVLSVLTATNLAPLLIEVKASRARLDNAGFHVTRNEWNTALQATHYCFHLWLLGEPPQLACVPVSELQNHIAHDHGLGRWETIEVPFAVFGGSFRAQAELLR